LPGIIKNPYGVGASGGQQGLRAAYCDCCSLKFTWTGSDREPPRQWCPECAAHYPEDGEAVDRELERLRAHEPRLIKRAADAARFAPQYEHDAHDAKERTAHALRRRAEVEGMLTEVAGAHFERPDGTCSCKARYPCLTVSVMARHDRYLLRKLQQRAEGNAVDQEALRNVGLADVRDADDF
jgi:hypothetical protein